MEYLFHGNNLGTLENGTHDNAISSDRDGNRFYADQSN